MSKYKRIFIPFFLVIILLLVGYKAYLSQSTLSKYDVSQSTKPETINTQLNYPDAYNGPLYAVSEKTGSEADFEKLYENMDRNGVNMSVIYFGYEAGGMGILGLDQELKGIVDANIARPGRVIAYLSTGIGGSGEGEMAENGELVGVYQKAYTEVESVVPGTVKGLGEIELYAWDMPHNDPKVLELMDFAEGNMLNVMIHPKVGKISELEDLLVKYPSTIFIVHMFHNDFAVEQQNISSLLDKYSNIYYTVDVDHMLFDQEAKIGLLYKYQDSSEQDAIDGFLKDYEVKNESMQIRALELYGPMIRNYPDKVIWGTEMHEEYTFDPAVYDKMIEFSRIFIGNFDSETQAKFAFGNAERVLGYGVIVE